MPETIALETRQDASTSRAELLPVPQISPESDPKRVVGLRRTILLLTLCITQLMDTMGTSCLYAAIPTLILDLNMSNSESIWVITSYQLTLGAFLLVSGKVTDAYRPKTTFLAGSVAVIALSIGAGFLRNKIALIVLRALLGVAAASTIPSALALIIYFYPNPKEQAKAVGAFGASAALGSVFGLIIGAVLTQYINWTWIFYVTAIVAFPLTVIVFILVPSGVVTGDIDPNLKGWSKVKELDLVGVALMTVALILFIFAFTESATDSWKSAIVLAPFFISIALMICFFWYETTIPTKRAAIPPYLWFIPNFTILFLAKMMPNGLGNSFFALSTVYWQQVFEWSVVNTAVHILPLGAGTMLFFVICSRPPLNEFILNKWMLLSGVLCLIIQAILMIFPDTPDSYFQYAFTGEVFGALGLAIIYLTTTVGSFAITTPAMSATVAAIFFAAAQLGSAIMTPIVTAISNSVIATQTGRTAYDNYAGDRAAYYFLIGVLVVLAIFVFFFYETIKVIPLHHRVPAQKKDSKEDLNSSLALVDVVNIVDQPIECP